jgi:hypothetical protein
VAAVAPDRRRKTFAAFFGHTKTKTTEKFPASPPTGFHVWLIRRLFHLFHAVSPVS